MHSVQTPGHMRTRSARTRAHAHTSTSTMRGHAHGRYLDAKDPKNSDEQEVDEDDVDTFGQRHKDKMDHVAEPRHLPNRLGCRYSPSA